MYHVTDNIFKYLNYNELKHAEIICDKWKVAIASGKIWEKCLKKKVSKMIVFM